MCFGNVVLVSDCHLLGRFWPRFACISCSCYLAPLAIELVFLMLRENLFNVGVG